MQNVPLRSVSSSFVTTTSAGTSSNSEVLALVELVESPPVRRGDHKAPNEWSFYVYKQYGDSFLDLRKGYFHVEPSWERSQSDFMIVESSIPEANPPGDVDWARTDDRAMEKIYDKIRGNSNFAVDLLEGGATIKMISNLRKLKRELLKSVVSTKKTKRYRRLTTSQERLDLATSKWLEYRYGWMPLVHSIYDALDTLGKRVNGSLFPVVGRSSVNIEDVNASGDGTYGSPVRIKKRSLSFRTEVAIVFRLPDSRQVYDWTSLNPLGIAWELLPLSFVADWVVNVSDVLSLWENYFIFANRFVRGYRTRSYREFTSVRRHGTSETEIMRAPNGDPYDQTYFWTISSGDRTYRKFMNREVLLALPLPAQGLRIRPELNAKRLLDAAALFHVFTKDMIRKL